VEPVIICGDVADMPVALSTSLKKLADNFTKTLKSQDYNPPRFKEIWLQKSR